MTRIVHSGTSVVLMFLLLSILVFSLAPASIHFVREYEGVFESVKIVHGEEVLDPTTGCASCHTGPVTVTCTSCHYQGSTVATPPPITLPDGDQGPVYFAHHDLTQTEAFTDCQNSACHDGVAGDSRYVVVVVAGHTYCGQCHDVNRRCTTCHR